MHNWLFYDSILLVAGTVAIVVALAYRHLRPIAIAGVVLVLTAIRPSGYLPAMYIIQMLPFFAIGVAGVADRIAAFILTYRARPVFWQQVTRLVAVTAVAVIAFVYVAPKWYAGDKNADTEDLNTGYSQAVEWLHAHVPHPGDQRIAVDDTLWLDMLQDGFKPSRYDIYFFKLDVDPTVMNPLGGAEQNKWKSIQWVVETPYLWENAACPTVSGPSLTRVRPTPPRCSCTTRRWSGTTASTRPTALRARTATSRSARSFLSRRE